jgi:hypothetical protein
MLVDRALRARCFDYAAPPPFVIAHDPPPASVLSSRRALTCIRPRRGHSYPQMSGMFFVNPAARFSRRFSVYQIQMHGFASWLFRWLTGADRPSVRINSRRHEAEFPAATQTAYHLLVGTFRGSRAKDRASSDALRPNYNWVKPEDQHDIPIIGEKWPAFARRLPQKGRQSPTPPERAIEGAGEEIVLAENHGAFHRWKTGTSGQTNVAADTQQRCRAVASAAQT